MNYTSDYSQLILGDEFEHTIIKRIKSRRFGTSGDMYIGGTRESITLYDAIGHFLSGLLLLPPHQREKCWPPEKVREYLLTLTADAFPPGNFEFYQLILEDGRKSNKYINDGSQRLRAAVEFYNNYKLFGLSEEDAKDLLINTSYPVTLKVHKTHQEAMRRFQIVNNNLALTPYQKSIGDLIYCQGDRLQGFWGEYIDKLHRIIYDSANRLSITPYPPQKSSNYISLVHFRKRHDLSLFYRFLKKEKQLINYYPGKDIVLQDIGKKTSRYFEYHLAELLSQLDETKANNILAQFENVIDLETALFTKCIDIVGDKEKKEGWTITYALHRWLLDMAIYRRNNEVSLSSWQDFIVKFIARSKGKTTIYYNDSAGTPTRLNVGLSLLTNIKRICTEVESDLLERAMDKRKSRVDLGIAKTGWQESHQEPFSINGNGETILEPGIINMSRGATSIPANPKPKQLMPCSHPQSAVISSNPDGIGTCYCSECAKENDVS